MIKNPKSDTQRQLRPLPTGQTAERGSGFGTILKLTDSTGLTTPGPDGKPTIEKENVFPGMARIFSAIPGVKRDDFAPNYRQFLVRK